MHTMEVEEPVALPQVDSLAASEHSNPSSAASHHDITTPSQVCVLMHTFIFFNPLTFHFI